MRRALLILVGLALLQTPALAGASTTASRSARGAEVVPGAYIVVFEESVSRPGSAANALGESLGFATRHRYSHALEGFAARLTSAQASALRAHPKVSAVVPDRVVRAAGVVAPATGDSAPAGIRRIEAAGDRFVQEASAARVAVIDSGVDLAHPDLNASGGVNCVGAGLPTDDNGHGTHVAGTIGAQNNGAGVVGVAPGTPIVSVKVLDGSGGGSMSTLICGIDWVASTRTDTDPANDIAVANMSLGAAGRPVAPCPTTRDPLHLAICRATDSGVTFVAAAGNSGWDYDYLPEPDVPAAYPEVLTVTAMTDGDGLGGGASSASCAPGERDDWYASFSNFATSDASKKHTIAAPGTCIRSTVPGGGYTTMSGTSMAAPHAAGAVALCFGPLDFPGPCRGLSPAAVIARMVESARAKTSATSGFGFVGDPVRPVSGRYYGSLVWGGAHDVVSPTITSVSPVASAVNVDPRTGIAVTFSEPMSAPSAQAAFSLWRASDGAPVPGSFTWSGNTMRFVPSSPLSEGTQYIASLATGARDAGGNRLAQSKQWGFTTFTTVSAAPVATAFVSGAWRSGSVANLSSADGLTYDTSSAYSGTNMSSWFGRFTAIPNSLQRLRVIDRAKSSRSCSQVLSLWRWSTSSWVDVDVRTVGTTAVSIDKAVAGAAADYVSGTTGDGELRLRVRCSTSAGSFLYSTDLMRISFTRA